MAGKCECLNNAHKQDRGRLFGSVKNATNKCVEILISQCAYGIVIKYWPQQQKMAAIVGSLLIPGTNSHIFMWCNPIQSII